MELYLMRHGVTVWNELGITQGHSRNRLSKRGKQQTEELAKELKNKKIDVIFCSPLVRTVQTAKIMNKYHKVKIIKDKRLIEINQGIFTGRKREELSKEELELKSARAKSCGMESFQSVYERIKDFFEKLKKLTYENVLIVSHETCVTLLEDIILNTKIDFNNRKHLRNFPHGEIKSFEI